MDNFKLNLYSKNSPSLESGKYKITVTQVLKVGVKDEIYQNTAEYQVESSGYDIDNKIEQVFPANGSTANYSNYIPHIIFNSSMLPWEYGDIPWMALISLRDDDEFILNKGKLDSITYSDISKNELEKEFNILELKSDLFRKLVPNDKELKLLAHVREVQLCTSQSTQFLKKAAENSTENNAPKVSVLLSNRLPGKGLNTLVLVSVKGLKDLSTQQGTENVKLIVLKKWSFENNTIEESFSTYLEQHIEANTFRLDSKSIENTDVKNLIDQGYVPLKNNAESSKVELYRGPLTPMLQKQIIPDNSEEAKTSPAYQLGRLLCLQNKSIAEAVFNNRVNNLRNASLQYEMNQQEVSLNKTLKTTLSEENALKGLHLNKLTDQLAKINSSKTK